METYMMDTEESHQGGKQEEGGRLQQGLHPLYRRGPTAVSFCGRTYGQLIRR
jgi:hypothetical protein